MKKLALISLFMLAGCDVDKYVEVAETALPKTVMIYNRVQIDTAQGSVTGTYSGAGVFVSPNGHIVTAAHLFDGVSEAITVQTYDGDYYAAEILAIERNDLALLKIEPIEGPFRFAKLANPLRLRVGQEVLAIGNPLRLDFSVSHGIISALHRDNTWVYNATQSDVMINPGNSGGPLFNMSGELVGINSFIVPVFAPLPLNTGLSFSVQSGQIIEFLTKVRQTYEGLPRFGMDYWL